MPKTRRSTDIFLQPGEYFVGGAKHRVRTVLGSCVSISIWHSATKTGAMCHFLLPSRGVVGAVSSDGRYADEALWLMMKELTSHKVPPAQCEAKLFGGGIMFPDQMNQGSINVGRNNGEAARSLLQAAGIPLVSESLFGTGHRQIVFDIATGDVWSRQVNPVETVEQSSRTAKGSV